MHTSSESLYNLVLMVGTLDLFCVGGCSSMRQKVRKDNLKVVLFFFCWLFTKFGNIVWAMKKVSV